MSIKESKAKRVKVWISGLVIPLLLLLTYSISHALLNENCTVSVLNRTAQVKEDGSWVIPNVPSNMGKVRVRATCVENGVTRSGQSDWVTIPTDAAIKVGDIPLDAFEPSPSSVSIASPTTALTVIGDTAQLTVTATYPGNSSRDITLGSAGTVYSTTNTVIATVSENGLVTATGNGRVIISASNEMVLSSILFTITQTNNSDADNDGIPDDWERANGLSPNDPIDALEDPDHDGLSNKQEYDSGTDLRIADSDSDGIQDGEETVAGGDGFITNPLLADSDGDGIRDGLEVQTGSNPVNPGSFNLSQALSSIEITPSNFVLVYNTIIGDSTQQLTVTGILTDGTSIDLTSTSRGTNYNSSDLIIANFGITDGLVYAGQDGIAVITTTNNGFNAFARATVRTFSPIPLSYLNIPASGYANNVDAANGYAYIAGGAGGLYIADVSNPNSPAIVGSVDTPGNANDVKVSGNTAFVADGSAGLQIIDVANPNAPEIIGSVDTPDNAWDVAILGTNAFIADGASGLQIVDISSLTNSVILGALDTAGTAKGVDVSGTIAVVADDETGVTVIDVTTPTNPILLGSVNAEGAVDLTIADKTVYLADRYDGLIAIDISNPSSPVVTSFESTGGRLYDVAVLGRFAFGADVMWQNAVPIYDIGDSDIIFRAILDFSNFRNDDGTGIAVLPDYLYLTASQNRQENGTIGNYDGYTRLYIGQYTDITDDGTIPPDVNITSPLDGAEVVEGSTITVNVSAEDDVTVASVSVLADGEVIGTDNSAPYQVNYQVPLGITSLVLGAAAIDLANNIGTAGNVYLSVVTNQPPSISITSPIAGGTYMEGSTITLSAEASDDVGISRVVFLVNGSPVSTDIASPYEVDYIIPSGSTGQMTIGAEVEDTIGQVSYASEIIINIIPDPGTMVTGRVIIANGQPVEGATVTTLGISAITGPDGGFSIPAVPTVKGDIIVNASAVINGQNLYGSSSAIPVPDGITNVGDITLKGFLAIAGGYQHSLALKSDGSLWAWGSNYYGQLGDGTTNSSLTPVQVSGLSNVVAIAAGFDHSLALKSDGNVWAWGTNWSGQLGDGTQTARYTPVQVSGLSNVVAIAAGYYYSLALKNDGSLWAWGANYWGQLGDGTTTRRLTPVQVNGLSNVVAIAAGSYHALAVTDDESVWAWGFNQSGQLGDGTTTNSLTPIQVSGLSGVKSIVAGDLHSLALMNNGNVWAWGHNAIGQLGDGTRTDRLTPVLVSGLSNVNAITTGGYHSLALMNNGNVWAWGWNSSGQLGDGTTIERLTPVQVSSLSNVNTIAAGNNHTLALKDYSSIWAWGQNGSGELGDGTITKRTTPVQVVQLVLISPLSDVIVIDAGGVHSLAVKGDGSVWSWGANDYGQLGDGTTIYKYNPVQINGLSGVIAINAGEYHTLALKSDGSVWAWGLNSYGQLGDGTITNRYTPVQVSGLSNVVAIAAGYYHSLALTNDGSVWAWGANGSGQLGDGTTTNRHTPFQLSSLSSMIAIAAGGSHSLAVMSDGSVWAWGANSAGQLGDGTTITRYTPVQTSGLIDIIAITAGSNFSLALKDDGSVWAWGYNNNGQLGDGTTTTRYTPVLVSTISSVIAIAAGYYHSLAVKGDGSIWAWGYNNYGQLGIGTTTTRYTPVQVNSLSNVNAIAAGTGHSLAIKGDEKSVWAWGQNYSGQLGDRTPFSKYTPIQVWLSEFVVFK